MIAVQAGPGTGKTHTLAARVRRHLSGQTGPCTVITFTNKAADELRERLNDQIHGEERLHISTFHGYSLRWLRKNDPGLTVLGGDDRALMLMRLEPALSPQQAGEKADKLDRLLGCPEGRATETVRHYQEELARQNSIDIDLVIPNLISILKEDTRQSSNIRAVTGALFVDEFQDINRDQYELISLLAASSPVFVIGDPDQSIYGFRGADVRWFSRFVDSFQAEVIQLTHNYRSGQRIIRCAEALIANNTDQRQRKSMQTNAKDPGAVYVQKCTTPAREARFILEHIESDLGGTSHRIIEGLKNTDQGEFALQDIAVLFRTSSQMESVSTLLAQRGIPYQRVDQKAFYTKKEIRPLFYAILLLAGRAQVEQQLFLIRQEKGIGEHAVRQITKWMSGCSKAPDILGQELHGLFASSGPSLLLAFQSFFHTIEKECTEGLATAELVERLASHYNLDAQHHDVQQLKRLAVNYGPDIDSFAAYLSRHSESVVYDAMSEAVTLSTLHAAKGLEFPVVFITGLEDEHIPLQPRQELDPDAMKAHVEEERRLLYVGITRAVNKLYLSWCESRIFNGKSRSCRLSPFYSELPAEFIEPAPVVTAPGKKQSAYRQLSLFS